jgi:hypothetical protein
MLDRITHIASELESAKVKAKPLFETLDMPQNPDGLRILDQNGEEVFLDAADRGFLGTRMVRIALRHSWVRGFFPCD